MEINEVEIRKLIEQNPEYLNAYRTNPIFHRAIQQFCIMGEQIDLNFIISIIFSLSQRKVNL